MIQHSVNFLRFLQSQTIRIEKIVGHSSWGILIELCTFKQGDHIHVPLMVLQCLSNFLFKPTGIKVCIECQNKTISYMKNKILKDKYYIINLLSIFQLIL